MIRQEPNRNDKPETLDWFQYRWRDAAESTRKQVHDLVDLKDEYLGLRGSREVLTHLREQCLFGQTRAMVAGRLGYPVTWSDSLVRQMTLRICFLIHDQLDFWAAAGSSLETWAVAGSHWVMPFGVDLHTVARFAEMEQRRKNTFVWQVDYLTVLAEVGRRAGLAGLSHEQATVALKKVLRSFKDLPEPVLTRLATGEKISLPDFHRAARHWQVNPCEELDEYIEMRREQLFDECELRASDEDVHRYSRALQLGTAVRGIRKMRNPATAGLDCSALDDPHSLFERAYAAGVLNDRAVQRRIALSTVLHSTAPMLHGGRRVAAALLSNGEQCGSVPALREDSMVRDFCDPQSAKTHPSAMLQELRAHEEFFDFGKALQYALSMTSKAFQYQREVIRIHFDWLSQQL